MPLELDPPQPEPLRRALESLLADSGGRAADAWWDAGIEEALSARPAPPEQRRQGDATARPRRTRGAERA